MGETTTAVRERPILFSGRLVRAILEDRKSVTRRTPGLELVNEQPEAWSYECAVSGANYRDGRPRHVFTHHASGEPVGIVCPYGAPGDQLWVRETFALPYARTATNPGAIYLADGPDFLPPATRKHNWTRAEQRGWWKPSIHMPRWASRLQLEITEVRVKRLQEIRRPDYLAEGVEPTVPGPHGERGAFMRLWDEINAARGYGWDANPWVWVIRFRRVGAHG